MNKSETTNTLNLSIPGYSVAFFDSIDNIISDWNSYAEDQLFLHSSFLKALESAPPSGTSYRYGIVRREGQLIGVTYFQVKKINLYLSLRLDTRTPSSLGQKFWHSVKSILAKRINQNVLVSGNMTLTGNYGSNFLEEMTQDDQFRLIDEISEELICKLRKEKIKIRGILLKDYFEAEKVGLTNHAFCEFQVQPNMIMTINPEWNTFEDYIMAMKSKYRVRVRRARKKAFDLEKRQLTLEEIHSYADDIARLYQNVADQAGFNLFILPKNYFYSLQKHLGNKMKLVAYFEEGRMTGFYTNIFDGHDMDAHFLGYEPNCNRKCQLYLNMLYDLVDDSIIARASKLTLSRTAMEIKSSIGAEPYDMFLYLKLTNSLLNKFVAKGLDYFKPKANWKPRSPFK